MSSSRPARVGRGCCFRRWSFRSESLPDRRVYTPDDIAAGITPEGPVVVFDFDNYYMAGAVAEQLAGQGGRRDLRDHGRQRIRLDLHDQ